MGGPARRSPMHRTGNRWPAACFRGRCDGLGPDGIRALARRGRDGHLFVTADAERQPWLGGDLNNPIIEPSVSGEFRLDTLELPRGGRLKKTLLAGCAAPVDTRVVRWI